PTVGDVRGKGLLAAVELVKDKKTRQGFEADSPFNAKLTEHFSRLGLLTRVRNIIAIAPPLIITKNEVDELVGILDEALGCTEKELSITG
ncbi:MAG: aminotransferase class III-fold pyridoxal phosphate-dependent enzyme, partial [Deltaproteobacteria bacterium]|nr:aminotransferase class III-fold pyridoxal phosphate-dependent enzyme [Deltaproteobacteria bacterium]